MLLHDSIPVHTSRDTQAVIQNRGFEQLSHPPYSSDMAPSDFYLFRDLKKELRENRFEDDNELKWTAEHWLEGGRKKLLYEGYRRAADEI